MKKSIFLRRVNATFALILLSEVNEKVWYKSSLNYMFDIFCFVYKVTYDTLDATV